MIVGLDNMEDIGDSKSNLWSVSCLRNEWELKKIGLLVSLESSVFQDG